MAIICAAADSLSLSVLDKLLSNEKFKDAPIDWMVNRKLIQRPNCIKCHKPFQDVHKLQMSRDVNEYWVCKSP